VAYHIDRERNERTAALGAQIGSGPADIASRARRVVSMVDITAQAEEIIVGAGGFVEAAQPGDVVISMSTIDPMAVQNAQEARCERSRLDRRAGQRHGAGGSSER
jgi:3-hydroxyisobutyrate dehydrogenase-like beta-hydroxyacid dehydrogenase